MTTTRRMVVSAPLMRAIRAANPGWFSAKNMRLFGDHYYTAYYGRVSGNPFMVRLTDAWTDMFGKPTRTHYRINAVDPETKKMGSLIDGEFNSLDAVRAWLMEN
jgi:hypothetical protein